MNDAFGVMKMSVDPNSNAEAYDKSLTFWQSVEDRYEERKKKWVEANARMIAAKLTAIRAKKQLEEARKLMETNSDSAIASGSLDVHFGDAKNEELPDVDPDMFKDPGDRHYSDSAIASGSLDVHFGDAKNEELPDVDPDMFKDPGDRHYSNSAIAIGSLDVHYGDARDEEFSDVDPEVFKDPGDRYYSNLDATMWENIRNDLMNIHRRAVNAPDERRRMVLRGIILSVILFMWIVIGVLYLFQKVEPEPIHGKYNTGSACHLDCADSSIIDAIIQSVFPAGHVDDEI